MHTQRRKTFATESARVSRSFTGYQKAVQTSLRQARDCLKSSLSQGTRRACWSSNGCYLARQRDWGVELDHILSYHPLSAEPRRYTLEGRDIKIQKRTERGDVARSRFCPINRSMGNEIPAATLTAHETAFYPSPRSPCQRWMGMLGKLATSALLKVR